MTRIHVLAPVLMLLSLSLGTPALAADHGSHQGHDDVRIQNPWSRPTPPGTPVGVGYMTIANHSDQAITLVGATSPRAGFVSIHQTSMQEGVMKMQPVEDGLEIPAGQSIELKPHSYHLMLEQLGQPLVEGEKIPLMLEFEGTGDREVRLVVRPLGGNSKATMDHSGMNH